MKLKSTLLKKGKNFSFLEEEHQREGKAVYTYLKVEHPGAVVILPEKSKGELVLLRQYRPSLDQYIYEFPAGTLELGEDPFVCAQRELAEEINSSAKNWTDLGKLLPAPGFCDEVQHCYFASGLGDAVAEKDPDEEIEVLSLGVKELEAMIQEGKLVDAKSIAIFLKARLQALI